MLSRGVGLRGFESHPPHHLRTRKLLVQTDGLRTIRHFIRDRTRSGERIQNLNQLVARDCSRRNGSRQRKLALQDETRGFREGERIAKISVWTLLVLGILEKVLSLISSSYCLFAAGENYDT